MFLAEVTLLLNEDDKKELWKRNQHYLGVMMHLRGCHRLPQCHNSLIRLIVDPNLIPDLTSFGSAVAQFLWISFFLLNIKLFFMVHIEDYDGYMNLPNLTRFRWLFSPHPDGSDLIYLLLWSNYRCECGGPTFFIILYALLHVGFCSLNHTHCSFFLHQISRFSF